MSLRVFAWDANPIVDSRLYRISNLRGEEEVAMGLADFITLPDGRRAIQLRPTLRERSEGVAGLSNLIPFGRVYNPMMHPPTLHYAVPHAGDVGVWRHFRRTIHVSSRKIDFAASAQTA